MYVKWVNFKCQEESRSLQPIDWTEKEYKNSSGVLKLIDFILTRVVQTSHSTKAEEGIVWETALWEVPARYSAPLPWVEDKQLASTIKYF